MADTMIYTPIAGVYIALVLSLLICSAIAYILGLFWFSDVRNRRLNSFFLLGVEIFLWTLLNAVSMVCNVVFFPVVYTLRMVIVCIVPFGVIWFILNFIGSVLCKKWLRNLFIIIASADILFLVTNPIHNLYFTDYDIPIPTRGLVFWVHTSVAFLFIGIAFIVYIQYVIKTAKQNPLLVLAGIGMMIPYTFNILYSIGDLPITFDITPIGFFITFIFFVLAAYRSGLLTQNLELKSTQRTMKAIFESNPHINVMFDSSFRMIDCNPSAIEFMGFETKEEMLSGFTDKFKKSIPELLPDEKPSIPMSTRLMTAASEGYSEFETELYVNGKKVVVVVEIKRIPYGDSFALLGYLIDLTAEREREKELIRRDRLLEAAIEEAHAANQAKSAFLASMSHEIRTPMNSIMGFAELALDKAISPNVKEYLGKITDSTKWLLRIINDILDISKIESGKMELENIPFDLHSIFTRCQSVIHPSLAEKGLDLRIYVEPPIGKCLMGDPVRLYQALMNLLSNAVKFTSAGTINLSSAIKCSDGDFMTVYFEVKDSGIGMTDEQINRIFDPFMQADSSTTRNYGGTGLGLAITKNIVELMGGQLTVESEPCAGSTFSFDLVFETVEAAEATAEYTEISIIERPFFDGLVLVCDDNRMNRQVICEHLAWVGLRTVVAENGKIGVEMVLERMGTNQPPFDMIFMDIFMPVMDGIEAALKINALGTQTPIVAMTANVMTSELDNYKKSGMHDCVGKPFTTQELWRCLLKHLTPVSVCVSDESDHVKDSDELQRKLRTRFVKDNQTKYCEITEALATGDIILAHRLAHTLKSNAGQIGKTALQNIAAKVETLIRDGSIQVESDSLSLLKDELAVVLDELEPLYDAPAEFDVTGNSNEEQAQVLFERLESMLENINPECVNLIDEIRNLTGTEELAWQIEDYDFESAARTLAELKKAGYATMDEPNKKAHTTSKPDMQYS